MKEKILIIDDEENTRKAATEALKEKAYQVIATTGNSKVIEKIEEYFDLLLIDLRLREMNGFYLLQRIKSIQPELSIILMTTGEDRENIMRSFQLGLKGFVLKPFTSTELLGCVEKTLEENRTIKEQIRIKVMNPLFEISKGFLHEIDLQDVLRLIVQIAKRETGADVASLMLLDEKTGELNIGASIGLPQEIIEGTKKKIGERIAGWVAEIKEPLFLSEDLYIDPWIKKAMVKTEVSSAICNPILRKDKVIGILNLSKMRGKVAFTQSDLELITVLCGQAAVIIDNKSLFEEVKRKTRELEEAHFDSIKALAEALETKDVYTMGHSDRTVNYALAVAERLGLSEKEKEVLKYAAIFHDIGKIGVKEDILNKPGKLTEDEYAEMKKHPEMGAEIIKHIKFLAPVVPFIYYHHERYDGTGYPTGLKGEAIPIGARIVSVLDAYDAMTTDRPYRLTPGKEKAIAELKRCSGIQFDPKVVDAFLDVLREEEKLENFPLI